MWLYIIQLQLVQQNTIVSCIIIQLYTYKRYSMKGADTDMLCSYYIAIYKPRDYYRRAFNCMMGIDKYCYVCHYEVYN